MAMVCGFAATTLESLYVLQARGVTLDFTEKALQKGHYENTASNLLLVGVLAAVASLHAMQRERYSLLGVLAASASFAGVALLLLGGLLGELVPAMAGQAILLLLVGLVGASAAVVGLGILTITAKVLPRWCGVALVVGSPLAW